MDDRFLELRFTKTFPEFELKVDATFPPTVTAIFGPSGSGKTTVLNCIAGLATPDGGEIRLDGVPLYSSSKKVQVPPERRHVGYVFQEGLLFPHLSVKDNISYGIKPTRQDSQSIALADLVELLELGPLMYRRPDGLSGGERQRVALARALATSPSLLLLDEPLASLDMAFRGRILRYLKAVHRQLSIPMIYVSHSISEVLAIAHRALILSGGKQVAFDEVRRVLAQPGVHSLVERGSLENLLDVEVRERREGSGTIVTLLGENPLYVADPYPGEDRIRQGDTVSVSIQAGDIIVAIDPPARISAQNILAARITEVHQAKSQVLVYADCGVPVVAEVTPEASTSLQLHPGQDVYLIIKSSSIMVLD